jgi:hypothetical protein
MGSQSSARRSQTAIGRPSAGAGARVLVALALCAGALATGAGGAGLVRATAAAPNSGADSTSGTVWLCRPGLADDPCGGSLTATRIAASGATSVVTAAPAADSRFDCFYVYPTVSLEPSVNADLKVQKTEIAAAIAQASRFSQVCRVFAPMYRQVTLAGLAAHPDLDLPAAEEALAYKSLLAGFEDYLSHYSDGRPIVFIGHSQGAALLIELLSRVIDGDPSLRQRLVLAIILGGDVEVASGRLAGGSFSHIPVCSSAGEHGCVIAYSSFPNAPPAGSLFGRVGQGVALQSGQTRRNGVEVVCVNPAAVGGGRGALDTYFPTAGALRTPWVEYPGLYEARCESAGGATWLEVTKATGSSDMRPVVSEEAGPDWGYHADDVNLALGNLVADVSSAEASWRG